MGLSAKSTGTTFTTTKRTATRDALTLSSISALYDHNVGTIALSLPPHPLSLPPPLHRLLLLLHHLPLGDPLTATRLQEVTKRKRRRCFKTNRQMTKGNAGGGETIAIKLNHD